MQQLYSAVVGLVIAACNLRSFMVCKILVFLQKKLINKKSLNKNSFTRCICDMYRITIPLI